MRFRTYQVALLVIFIVSVLIRIPNFDRPLSKHHEFNAAMVLIGMDYWNENGGPSSTYHTPVLNYSKEGDRNLDLQTSLLTDAKGNLIYASFGAGWFLYPYYFFKVFALTPAPATLTIFNLILSFVCMLLVFTIARKVFSEQDSNSPIKSLGVVFLYVLNPCTLWYTGNGYVHEVMVLPFFLMQVNIFIDFIKRESAFSKGQLLLYFFVTVLGVFSDWLCIVWLMVTIVFALKRVSAERKWISYLLVAAVSGIFSVLLVIGHYGYYLGIENYINALANRYQSRGMLNISIKSVDDFLFKIVKHYFTSYLSLLLLISIFAGLFLIKLFKRQKITFNLDTASKSILFLTFFTASLHHIIFMEFTSVHEYAVLKAALFLSLATGVLLFASNTPIKASLLIFFIASILQYYYINRIGQISLNGDRYDYAKVTGKIIQKNAYDTEVVFVKDSKMRPQISYYAKRTILDATTLEQAKLVLRQQPGKLKGVWFDIDNGAVVSINHFDID